MSKPWEEQKAEGFMFILPLYKMILAELQPKATARGSGQVGST
ncbi:hypothetical protein [Bacillus sp. ISL-55]|nr:hypothetical protein [Bacillus sp. ISL-55]